MALNAEQFGKAVVASGLMTAEELRSLWAELPAADRPKDGEAFSSVLLKRERLNEFQAKEVLSGSGTPLVLGDYVLLSKIGAGGMGQVFKAHHRRMDRLAAIKLLPASLTKDEATVKRFEREVKAAAKLSHPNIVQTFDAGVQRGVHYLVMEHVDGRDLSAIVKERGPLPVPEAVDCILQAARGLAFAHSKGVVHRDIKPANLLIDGEGVVKILDMGLARFDSSGDAADHQLTNTGAVMGTVDYMAPEQAQDTHAADARSDVYSLGCSLYRLLTGESVYYGDSVVKKIFAHAGDPIPSLLTKRPDCSAEIDRIFQKMLAKRPDDRYQQAAQVVAELEAWRNPGATTSFSGSTAASQDANLNDFFRAVGGAKPASSQSSAGVKTATKHTAIGVPEQTAAYSGADVQTDPKSEIVPSLAVRAKPSPTATKPKGSGKGGKNPPVRLIAGGILGVALLIVAGIIIKVRDKDGNVVAQLDVPEGASAEVRTTGGAAPSGTASFALGVTAAKPSGTSFFTPAPATPRVPMIYEPAGPPVDLLKHIDLAKGGTHQTGARNWEWQEFAKVLRAETSNRTVTIPVDFQPPAAYRLEIQFAPQSQGRMRYYCFGLAAAARRFALVVDRLDAAKLQDPGPWTGLQTLDGYPAMRNETSVKGEFIPADVPSQLQIEVGPDGVRAWINGKQQVDYRGNMDRLSPAFPRRDDAQPDNGTNSDLWLQVHEKTDFTKLSLTPLVGKPAAVRTGTAPTTADVAALSGNPPPAVFPFNAATALKHQQAWAAHLSTQVETTNSVGAKMVLIPPGEFLMGSSDEQVAVTVKAAEEAKTDQQDKDRIEKAERPQHRVVITKPFLMGATEVTIDQFRKFVEASKYITEAEKYGFGDSSGKATADKATSVQKQLSWRDPGYAVTDDSPVAQATWNDAVAYCTWLSSREQTTYRLPTEAEWEYACRAGTQNQYSFGDDDSALGNYGWYIKNARSKSNPVETKLPNAFGLYDMHGNLQEWCQDFYEETSYANSPSNDPTGPISNSSRVARGGAWSNSTILCRSACRNHYSPSLRFNNSGFRVVRTVDAPAATASITPQPTVPASPGKLFMHDPAFPQWMAQVQAMPAEEQIKAVSKKLMELNPGFDGKVTGATGTALISPAVSNGEVTAFGFSTTDVFDVSPIRAFTGLKALRCIGSYTGNRAQLSDLSPIQGMGLTFLQFDATSISDLAPLKGMPLTDLRLRSSDVTDVSLLANFKSLAKLTLGKTKVTPAQVATLQKALPACKIEWDDPTKSVADSVISTPPSLAKAPFDAAQAKAHQQAWAKHLGTEVETINSVGAKMALIPPGEFMMGSTDAQVEAALKVADEIKIDDGTKDRIQKNERPQHKVVITKPFLMNATEVTIGQFKKFSATGYVTEAEKEEIKTKSSPPPKTTPSQPPIALNPIQTYLNPGYVVTDDSPAAVITWNDAVAYCNWLSTQEKLESCYRPDGNAWQLLPGKNGYRLPTEAEWEYACRAGTTTQYSFGDDHQQLEQYGWYGKNANLRSYAVGTKLPNPFGLFDMHGNLQEWCGDFYDEKWYTASPPNDPSGPSTGSTRVLRGGNWHLYVSYCRSAYRNISTPSSRRYGFRCVRLLNAPSTTASITSQPAVPAPPGKLFMHAPAFPQWMKDVQAMPAEEQIEAVRKKLMELNPGFDGKVLDADGKPVPKIENGVVTELSIITDHVTDISPMRALVKLRLLKCFGSGPGKGSLTDLSPLQGMPLESLSAFNTPVTDLSSLKGMPLTKLYFHGSQVFDLSPLRGMKLTNLGCKNTPVSDLSPLKGMPLRYLDCEDTPVSNLLPLQDCKNLSVLIAQGTKVTPAAVAALQKSLPNCKIEWDDPAKPTTQPAASGTK